MSFIQDFIECPIPFHCSAVQCYRVKIWRNSQSLLNNLCRLQNAIDINYKVFPVCQFVSALQLRLTSCELIIKATAAANRSKLAQIFHLIWIRILKNLPIFTFLCSLAALVNAEIIKKLTLVVAWAHSCPKWKNHCFVDSFSLFNKLPVNYAHHSHVSTRAKEGCCRVYLKLFMEGWKRTPMIKVQKVLL